MKDLTHAFASAVGWKMKDLTPRLRQLRARLEQPHAVLELGHPQREVVGLFAAHEP
jgi:hypothetical protein